MHSSSSSYGGFSSSLRFSSPSSLLKSRAPQLDEPLERFLHHAQTEKARESPIRPGYRSRLFNEVGVSAASEAPAPPALPVATAAPSPAVPAVPRSRFDELFVRLILLARSHAAADSRVSQLGSEKVRLSGDVERLQVNLVERERECIKLRALVENLSSQHAAEERRTLQRVHSLESERESQRVLLDRLHEDSRAFQHHFNQLRAQLEGAQQAAARQQQEIVRLQQELTRAHQMVAVKDSELAQHAELGSLIQNLSHKMQQKK